jgi:hypothetical protein
MSLGKLGKAFQTAKRFIGKTAQSGLLGSRILGKGFGGVRDTYQIGKQFTRNIANKLDKKLGTAGAFRGIADTGIRALGGSAAGQAVKSGLDEAENINRSVQGGLQLLAGGR